MNNLWLHCVWCVCVCVCVCVGVGVHVSTYTFYIFVCSFQLPAQLVQQHLVQVSDL